MTELGHAQASRVARILATAGVVGLYASPQRRARETAAPIALAVGVDMSIDVRLSERMNWEGPGQQTADVFYEEWKRTVADRDYVPSHGDSSAAAAIRFETFLNDTDRSHGAGPIAIVSHGGVTIDLLRNLLGDERLHTARPGLVESGILPCGLTTIAGSPGRWSVLGIGESCPGETDG